MIFCIFEVILLGVNEIFVNWFVCVFVLFGFRLGFFSNFFIIILFVGMYFFEFFYICFCYCDINLFLLVLVEICKFFVDVIWEINDFVVKYILYGFVNC